MHYLYGQVRVTIFVHISQTTHTKASQHFLDILGKVCYHWRPRSCNLIFVQTSSINRTCQFLQFASKAFPCWLCPSARFAFPGMELLREHPLVPTGKNSWKLRCVSIDLYEVEGRDLWFKYHLLWICSGAWLHKKLLAELCLIQSYLGIFLDSSKYTWFPTFTWIPCHHIWWRLSPLCWSAVACPHSSPPPLWLSRWWNTDSFS